MGGIDPHDHDTSQPNVTLGKRAEVILFVIVVAQALPHSQKENDFQRMYADVKKPLIFEKDSTNQRV